MVEASSGSAHGGGAPSRGTLANGRSASAAVLRHARRATRSQGTVERDFALGLATRGRRCRAAAAAHLRTAGRLDPHPRLLVLRGPAQPRRTRAARHALGQVVRAAWVVVFEAGWAHTVRCTLGQPDDSTDALLPVTRGPVLPRRGRAARHALGHVMRTPRVVVFETGGSARARSRPSGVRGAGGGLRDGRAHTVRRMSSKP